MTSVDTYAVAARKLQEADAVLIGASNGLSITEGLHIFADNENFEALFGDMKARFGLRNILHGAMAQWPTEVDKWTFWTRLISHYCLNYKPSGVMQDLKHLVADKDYFVITTNGEAHFELCGFESTRIYEPEGNWLSMQCADRCHDTLYPSSGLIAKMKEAIDREGTIPESLIPKCPHCSAPMQIHVYTNDAFIEEEPPRRRFNDFIHRNAGRKIVLLELGVGARNAFIKRPFLQLLSQEPQAFYIPINLGEMTVPAGLDAKSLPLYAPISTALEQILHCR